MLQNVPGDISQNAAQESGNLQSDPWSNWIKLNGTSGISQPIVPAKPVPQQNVAQPPRRLESPIEDKFQRQEEQIQLVRQSAEKEILALREDMSKLEKMVDSQRMQIDSNMEATASEFHALRAETTDQFQSMAELFKDSLSSAIQVHDSAMSSQFMELKELIAANQTRASPPPKKAKCNEKDPYQP